ncbi:GNAT family N-acetyltransferase [Streptomyces sp. DW26H14]|uniref:GNAT family N-acetyltransferase n=1 Tax=Streptomyces sp. DW26H14 TaxID=3435395 RepID=UPI00403DE6D5
MVGATAGTAEAERAGEVSDAHEGAGATQGAGAEAAAARGDASRGGPGPARAVRPGPGRGTILGFYALLLTPPEPELDLLFVADAAQGRGIGRLLMDHMKATARAAGEDHVRVVSHPPAEGFYTSVGALRTGVIRAYPPAVPWDRPELSIPTTP